MHDDLCPHGRQLMAGIEKDLETIDAGLAYAAAACTTPTGQKYIKDAQHALDRVRRTTHNPDSETP